MSGGPRDPGGTHTCPVCGTQGMERFYSVESVPTNSCLLMESPEEARAFPRGDIHLAACDSCGFVSNVAFDPALTEYSGRYEATQGFSGTFSAFHEELARRLVERYHLEERDILEIGCGQGEFLRLLADLGGNRGLGFDPAYRGGETGSVTVEAAFFTDEHAHLAADLVCCKMTLEHIHDPRPLLRAVGRVASNREGTLAFFQVPDATRIFRDCAFEDIYYEHCSYYVPSALTELLRRTGFRVLCVESVFEGQYLTIEARWPGSGGPLGGDPRRRRERVATFGERCGTRLEEWQERLDAFRRAEREVVLWGSGSKAVSFLTTLDHTEVIRHVVDINPFRQGHFMPGTGQPIVSPERLGELEPDVVVILNRAYVGEITAQLDELGLAPELEAL